MTAKTKSKNGTDTTEDEGEEDARPVVNVRTATFTIRGIAPLCWTKPLPRKGDDEPGDKYEERVWRQKVHVVEGKIAIPSVGLRNSFAEGGKDVSIGKGSARAKNLMLRTTIPDGAFYLTNKALDDLRSEWRMMPTGSNSDNRVPKLLPMLDPGWTCTGSFTVLDDRLTKDRLSVAIVRGGLTCGVGALRVEGGGVLGRYELVDLDI